MPSDDDDLGRARTRASMIVIRATIAAGISHTIGSSQARCERAIIVSPWNSILPAVGS